MKIINTRFKDISDDKNMLDEVNKMADKKISNFESLPLAIGLNFLTGWSLSFFMSKKSLIKYIEEDIKQKDKKANEVA